MCDKNEFISLIKDFQEYYSKIDKLSKELNLNLYESSLTDYTFKLFDHTVSSNFSEEGADIINWFLYEKSADNSLGFFVEGEEVPSDTAENLWEIVKDYRKSITHRLKTCGLVTKSVDCGRSGD